MNSVDKIHNELLSKYGATENHFQSFALTDEQEASGYDVSDDTLAVLQGLLSRCAHEKVNVVINTEYPFETQLKLATIDGKIAVLREVMDRIFESRTIKAYQR